MSVRRAPNVHERVLLEKEGLQSEALSLPSFYSGAFFREEMYSLEPLR